MSAFMVSTVHVDAMLTAGLTFADDAWRPPLSWFWPALEAASDEGNWTSHELDRQIEQRRRVLTVDTAGRVGAMLLAANRRSVDHRYAERDWETPYLLTRLPGAPDPVIVLKAIACYEYQSCEHPGWPASEAHAFARALESAAIRRLPGYDRAPWEITSVDVFTDAAAGSGHSHRHSS